MSPYCVTRNAEDSGIPSSCFLLYERRSHLAEVGVMVVGKRAGWVFTVCAPKTMPVLSDSLWECQGLGESGEHPSPQPDLSHQLPL